MGADICLAGGERGRRGDGDCVCGACKERGWMWMEKRNSGASACADAPRLSRDSAACRTRLPRTPHSDTDLAELWEGVLRRGRDAGVRVGARVGGEREASEKRAALFVRVWV